MALLSERPEALRNRLPGVPGWLSTLGRVYGNGSGPADGRGSTSGARDDRGGEEGSEDGLGLVFEPLLTQARERLNDRLVPLAERHPRPPMDLSAILEELTRTLSAELRRMAERAVVLEFHVRRLEDRLPQGEPATRFQEFVASLSTPRWALDFLREYPVLARRAVERTEAWIESSYELLDRFARDRERIHEVFSPAADPGSLTGVTTGRGDRHEGGRSVSILTFSSGLKVVYKPRSLAVDRAFEALVRWLDERGADPPLAALRVLDRGQYGWQEFVLTRPAADEAAVERFFQRQGAWAALLFVLEGSDFHYENVIAVGEHPILVDLETLFRPRVGDPAPMGPGSDPLRETVLGTNLLPQRQWSHEPWGGLDLSGLSAAPGQVMEVRELASEPGEVPRFTVRKAALPGGSNLPTLNGERVLPWAWRDAVERGFEGMYRLLLRERESLLAPDGPLQAFRGVDVRLIQRGTAIYARLLSAAVHPDYLQDGLQQDRLFDKLWLDGARYASLRRLIPIEAASLARGEIPRFTVRTDSYDLQCPGGGRIDGYFTATGWELARRRLETLDDRDLEFQRRLLRASLQTLKPASERRSWPREPLPEPVDPAPRERFLGAARLLGERLADDAVEHWDGHVSWIHLEVGPRGLWSLSPVPVDLYDGLFGIALFLAQLGAELDDEEQAERFTTLARRAVATAHARIRHNPSAVRRIGGFEGWGGVIYACCRLAGLWGEPELLDAGEAHAHRAAEQLDEDRAFDVLGGAAGLGAALLALHAARPAPWILDAATRCGEHLLRHGERSERGLAWPPPPGAGTVPLTGFGHGAAGVAWVLAGLAAADGDRRWAEAARDALSYERSWFSPEKRNWPDLREDRRKDGIPPFLYAWCHGAPGIGLGRLAMLGAVDDPDLSGEVRAAVSSTLAEGFGQSHCLCHGDLGNLELLVEAARRLDDPELGRRAESLAARILASVEEAGPRCGASTATEPPGLMAGLAGIGYGLLRAASPERVPSVLLLEVFPDQVDGGFPGQDRLPDPEVDVGAQPKT
ncbi:MAG: type 2 lanthipeptide synthetase LanM family protein [Thermoanaerobaculia bacterium]